MKTILLSVIVCGIATGTIAQKKSKENVAYAITAREKGGSNWAHVKKIDLKTGQEVSSVFNSADKFEIFDARTKKPINIENNKTDLAGTVLVDGKVTITNDDGVKRIYLLNATKNGSTDALVEKTKHVFILRKDNKNPFSTNSAACAYDKKHDRLYYTPMGVNELRYIDLKSKTPKIYYHKDETFGAVKGMGDYNNQITRMVIAADGNGYALSNNANNFIRFKTNKTAEITDLGALTDDPSNGKNSVSSRKAHGGDMVSDNKGNLYLITAFRSVFKINIESKVAKYLGQIEGLPEGFTTNGAVVESGSKIIVNSSTHTTGYYIFDLNDLKATTYTTGETVYNASDLANDKFINAKKVDKNEDEPVKELLVKETPSEVIKENISTSKLTVYPNPATTGFVNLSFDGFANGRYNVSVLDLNGKLIQKTSVRVNGKQQVYKLNLPGSLAKGNYLVNVVNAEGKIISAEKLLIQ